MSAFKRKRTAWLPGALGAAGGIAGGAITGSPFGGDLGYQAGRAAGHYIKSFTGFGAYSVNQNTLYEGSQTPFVTNANMENAMVIAHREYLGDITTSANAGDFQSEEFTVNPCLVKTFPWLNALANQFEEWLPMGIIFFFKTTSSDALNSTNTALGNVMMAAQYNVYQPDFGDKLEMENHAYNMSCKPSTNLLMPIECAPSQNQVSIHYTRPGNQPIPQNADQRLYDLAVLTIATEGMQAASVNIGELHIAYQIAFFKPRLLRSIQQSPALSQLRWQDTSNAGFWVADPTDTGGNLTATAMVGTKPDPGRNEIFINYTLPRNYVGQRMQIDLTFQGPMGDIKALFVLLLPQTSGVTVINEICMSVLTPAGTVPGDNFGYRGVFDVDEVDIELQFRAVAPADSDWTGGAQIIINYTLSPLFT